MADPISHVNVTRIGDELLVTWRGGDTATTSVFVSKDPNDAGVDVRAPDGHGRIAIAAERARTYVHLFDAGSGFVVAADRRVELDGPENFRDIGGYPTMDGRYTRWGRVFRADGLAALTDSDHETIGGLGIRHAFDLRSGSETDERPDRLPAHVRYTHLPMTSDVAQARSLHQRIVDGDLTSYSEADMAAGYLRMLEHFGAAFVHMVEHAAAGQPMVVHCSAGKDRTGLAAMVMLGLAGVADPYILDDYELSARYRDAAAPDAFDRELSAVGLDPGDFAAMWGTPRPVMRATLDGLYERWGSIDRYLREMGADEAALDGARTSLRIEDT